MLERNTNAASTMNPAHLLRLVQQQNAAQRANGSAALQEAARTAREHEWTGLVPGAPCRLTQEALDGAQGDGAPLRLREDSTPCRILRIDVERGLALILIETPNEGPNTLAQECTRSDILLVLDESPEVDADAAPPAPPPPPPPPIRSMPTSSRRRRLPAVW